MAVRLAAGAAAGPVVFLVGAASIGLNVLVHPAVAEATMVGALLGATGGLPLLVAVNLRHRRT